MTYSPASVRVEKQIAGRAGRAGEPGEFQPILLPEVILNQEAERAKVPAQVRSQVAQYLRTDAKFDAILPFVKHQEANKEMLEGR